MKRYLLLLVIFLGICGIFGYYFFAKQSSKSVNFEVSSEIGDVGKIYVSNRKVLNHWLETIGYIKPSVKVRFPGTKAFQNVASIKIIYTDKEQDEGDFRYCRRDLPCDCFSD